jgi:ketosteroid isomerase-like protein
MYVRDPAEAIELIDNAFQNADIETLASLYDDAAVVIPTEVAPGLEIRGNANLWDFYFSFLRPGAFTVTRIKTHVIEADGIALATSFLSLGKRHAPPQTVVATVVFRRQRNGGWKALINSSSAVLDQISQNNACLRKDQAFGSAGLIGPSSAWPQAKASAGTGQQ